MAALQKFKILATQCGVVQSPTRSPRTSPLVQLPRKKTTLRMLLTKTTTSRHSQKLLTSQQEVVADLESDMLQEKKKKKKCQSNTLKDLFVSSFEDYNDKAGDDVDDDDGRIREKSEVLLARKLQVGLGGELGLSRPVWVGSRHRLLKKAWRPMLASIPE